MFVCLLQFYGYVVLVGFSVGIVFIVGIYDCYKSGKCCRRTHQETQEDQQDVAEAGSQGGEQSGEREEVHEATQSVEIPLNTINSAPANAGDKSESTT